MSSTTATDPGVQISNLKQYYKLHALIYDATRWAFLFGRQRILEELPFDKDAEINILEVGCGTGRNLEDLAARFPKAQLTGIDVSADMLEKARKKLGDRAKLVEEPYQAGCAAGTGFDLILFSYSLSMINPQWSEILDQAQVDLKPGGLVAACDFSDTASNLFRAHMGNNHVRMDGLPGLRERFTPVLDKEPPAYMGVWKYLLFLGRKA